MDVEWNLKTVKYVFHDSVLNKHIYLYLYIINEYIYWSERITEVSLRTAFIVYECHITYFLPLSWNIT
jgi:hypothetical protein